MPLKACGRCGKIHEFNKCSIPVVDNYKRKQTYQRTFRSSALWQRKRAEILKRDCYVCRLCLYRGRISNKGLEVHHIVPIKVNQSLELVNDNLITVCSTCHEEIEGNKEYVDFCREIIKSPPSKFIL